MKETEIKIQADPVLDAELAQMAEEVPPMPADFHDRWMNAIRAEAEKNAPAEEKKKKNNLVSMTRWTRILSVAAVFVFLIGGTILYRNSRKTLTGADFRTETVNAALTADEAPAAAMGTETREEAAGEAYAVAGSAEMMATEAAEEAAEDYALPNYAAAVYTEAEEAAEEETVIADAVKADADAGAAESKSAMKAAGTSLLSADAYEAENSMEAAEEIAALPEAESTAEPVPEREQETAEPAKAAGFTEQAGAFLADMGDFLLAALPYLAVLAVPAAAALIIRKRKKK